MSTNKETVAQVMDNLRDKIRFNLAEAIPEDVWQQMIQKEIDDFMEPKVKATYAPEVKYSDFQMLVRHELQEACKVRLRALLSSPEWDVYWDGTRHTTSKFVTKFFQENAAVVIEGLLGKAFQDAITQARSNI